MRKLIRYLGLCILIGICINVGMYIFHRLFLKTSDVLSLSYTPSASPYYEENYFYVHDNVLYFVDDCSTKGKMAVKYVKNNVIHMFAKIPNTYDRFIIIDNKLLYHCGASFKDLGKKCFGINKVEDDTWLKELLKFI